MVILKITNKERGIAMKIVIILYSLCVAFLILTKTISMGLFMTLLIIEYILILAFNNEFRLIAKNKFKINRTFGNENKSYGRVHRKTLKEDMEKMQPEAFIQFVGDVFKKLGYKVSLAKNDFGGDLIISSGDSATLVEIKHKSKSNEAVDNHSVERIAAAVRVYKITHGMVLTNGTFTDKAYQEARACQIAMIDGFELMNLVRQVMLENKEDVEEEKKAQDIESVLSDTLAEVTLEEALEDIPTVMMDEQVLSIHNEDTNNAQHES